MDKQVEYKVCVCDIYTYIMMLQMYSISDKYIWYQYMSRFQQGD